jgi:ATP-dependent DNA helicase RecG
MSAAEDIALVDRLRAEPSETEWLEFKRDRYDAQLLGEYVSALANSAALAGKPVGHLVFGVDDATHAVVGTAFDPYTTKAKGNQDLLPWLTASLHPNTGVEVRAIQHPGGRVVVLTVGAARDRPVAFRSTSYVRVGSSKTELRKHQEKERALWLRGVDWSAAACEAATLADLDPAAILKAREQFATKHPAQAGDVASWDDVTFLNKAS